MTTLAKPAAARTDKSLTLLYQPELLISVHLKRLIIKGEPQVK